ncbi:MAG: hypothetical protein NTY38_16365, partial [Acidobacteria bacterium]|nr:hypothetical protein [Acidobacteriota bacterium]
MSDGIGFLILIGLVLLISGPAGALIALRARRKVREVEARLTSQELQTEYRLSELTARLYGLEHPERQWEMAPEAAMEPVAAIPVEETPAPPEAEVEPEVVLAPPVAAPPSWGERVRQRVGNEEWEAMIG